MSTRSNIAIQYDDGTVLATNCNFDGYVKGGVGEALFMRATTPESATSLIEGGELRCYSINDYEYYDNGRPARFYDDLAKYSMDMSRNCADYFYLFKNGQWYFSKHHFDLATMSLVGTALGKQITSHVSNPLKNFAEEQIANTQNMINQKQKRISDLRVEFVKHNMSADEVKAHDIFILLQNEIMELDVLQIELDAFIAVVKVN